MPDTMSSKLEKHREAPLALPEASALLLEGRDAAGFAQSQFANDVTSLSPGRWQWNAWLNPKGRVIALFRLARLDAERLLLVLPDFPAAELAQRLGRFVFRSKVTISALPQAVCGLWGEADADSGEHALLGSLEGQLGLQLEDGRRVLLSEPCAANPDQLEAWRLADIRAGVPRLDAADAEAYTAHMLGLDRLQAFSLKKGCFPGHEILARSHYLGQVKRGLRHIRSAAPLPQRAEVQREGQTIGQVLCSASAEDGYSEALAVLPVELDPSSAALLVEGAPIDLA